MRRRRLLGEREEGAVYHVVSRVVNGERLFDAEAREVLRGLLGRVADFSGVRLLTFALMENHFHLLVYVPPPEEVEDAELVRRFRVLYPRPTTHQPMTAAVLERLLAAGDPRGVEVGRRLRRRMGSLSEFAKTLKLRFSIWRNRTLGRFGPLWSDRFRSVLVQGRREALLCVAAYIDLNPVRAGMVPDPKDYRWCGYHEAVAGRAAARHGLAGILDGPGADPPSPERARQGLREYRRLLFSSGAEGREGKACLDAAEVRRVLAAGGRLSAAEAARVRLEHLTYGLVLGSRAYVRRTAGRAMAARTAGPRARPVRLDYLEPDNDLAVLRGRPVRLAA